MAAHWFSKTKNLNLISWLFHQRILNENQEQKDTVWEKKVFYSCKWKQDWNCLVLIQPFPLYYLNQVVLMFTSNFFSLITIKKEGGRFVSKWGQPRPHAFLRATLFEISLDSWPLANVPGANYYKARWLSSLSSINLPVHTISCSDSMSIFAVFIDHTFGIQVQGLTTKNDNLFHGLFILCLQITIT